MIKPFTCPVCGITQDLTYVGNRKKCPDCAREWAKIRTAKTHADKKDIYQERKKAKEQQKKVEKEVTLTPQQKLDAEQNARMALQMKQCRKCAYHCKEYGLEYCDFISWHGHSTEKGNGPGDCRSFRPKGTIKPSDRIARRKIALARSEADHAR